MIKPLSTSSIAALKSWFVRRNARRFTLSFCNPNSCICANIRRKFDGLGKTNGEWTCCIACVNISAVIIREFALLAEVEEEESERGKLPALALETAAASCATVTAEFVGLEDKFDGCVESEDWEESPAISSSPLKLSKL